MNNSIYLRKATDSLILAKDYKAKGNMEAAKKEYTKCVNFYDIAHQLEQDKTKKDDIMLRRNICFEKIKSCECKKLPPQTNDNSSDDDEEGSAAEGSTKKDQFSKFKPHIMATMSKPVDITFDSVAGLENAKKIFRQTFLFPEKFPDYFNNGAKPWNTMMLYGPPGTGKTHIAKAVACENKKTFFSLSSSDLVNKYVGESEKYIKALFMVAKENVPCIVFIDEIDSMVTKRSDNDSEGASKVKSEFLVQLNSAIETEGFFFMCATNFPWNIDGAFLRRMNHTVYIPLPEQSARAEIIRINLKKVKHKLTDDDINNVAERLEGFSGADIQLLVMKVLMKPVDLLDNAKYFRKNDDGKFIPMDGSKIDLMDDLPPDVVQTTWKSIDPQMVGKVEIDNDLFMSCLKDARSTVNRETVKQYENLFI